MDFFAKETIAAAPSSTQASVGYDKAEDALVAVDSGGVKYQLCGFTIVTYRLFRVVMLSTGTYTPTTGVKALYVECQGGGGGGGGAPTKSSGSFAIVAGGGSSGSYSASWILNPAASYSVTVGTGGGGGSGAANGSSGNNTDFGSGPTVRGLGGVGGTQGVANTATVGAVAGGSSTSVGIGDVTLAPNSGGFGLNDGNNGQAGNGGRGFLGGSPAGPCNTSANGNNGQNGSGGSGAMNLNASGSTHTGGTGGTGWCRVWEYM